MDTARTGRLDFLIKIEPSGRWGHQFDSLDVGARMGVQRTVRIVHAALQPAGGAVPVHRRRHRHRADPRDDSSGAAGGAAPAMRLLYSAKTADDFAYLPELGDMAEKDGLDLRLHVTREAPGASAHRPGAARPAHRNAGDALFRLRPGVDGRRRAADAARARDRSSAHPGRGVVTQAELRIRRMKIEGFSEDGGLKNDDSFGG